MGLERYRTLILAVTAITALILASPALQQFIVEPQTDRLTEMWLLGPDHTAAYPSNVTSGENYRLYLDVSNHLGSCAYYAVEIKFRNESQSAPGSFNHTNSDLPSIGKLTLLAANDQTTEMPLDITFNYKVNNATSTRLDIEDITINGVALHPDATTINYDKDKGAFYGNLFFELYLYNQTSSTFQYNERYNSLWLKMNTAEETT
ncbi:MAG: DUF1616 domain-containing protein [Candidatus Bathyarchaeia archaeon]|jgi:uncharacterized membrane protein